MNGEETTDKQQTWWSQFVILLWRIFKERKLEFLSFIRLLQTLAVAFVVSVLWWDSNTDSQRDREDQVRKNMELKCATLYFCFSVTTLHIKIE